MIDLRKIPRKHVEVPCQCGETHMWYNPSDPKAVGQSTQHCVKCNRQRYLGGYRIRHIIGLAHDAAAKEKP